MEKKHVVKKLSLSKETLISLQDKQMKAVIGGLEAVLWTSGETSGCPTADCNDSCCKKSCKKADVPQEEVDPGT